MDQARLQPDAASWQIWIDTGGTFTDCIGIGPDGRMHRAKVLSSGVLRGRIERIESETALAVEAGWTANPAVLGMRAAADGEIASVVDHGPGRLVFDRPLPDLEENGSIELFADEEAPILGARLMTRTPAGGALPRMQMRLATTRGTNALLERKGPPTALFITEGFGDLLLIGDQTRPDLFALDIRKPEPLHGPVVEVAGRLDAHGRQIRPLELDAVRNQAASLVRDGIRCAAVVLMHSWVNRDHEQSVKRVLQEVGFEHISCSEELSPTIKILHRAQTAVADAYLAQIIESYLRRVHGALTDGDLHVMTSSGGLVSARNYHAKDSLLSGPAGGVVGAAAAGRRSGFTKIIALDMGGTSTDVSRFDGDYEYVFEHTVGQARIAAPALAIETVAAGGGSICDFAADHLAVGPHSAGADPGPACYGRGGPLTLTDANVLLGRLDPAGFGIPVQPEPAAAHMERIRLAVGKHSDEKSSDEELLEGFIAIADERMAEAIGRISIRQGYDPSDYALVAFGGAGPQHACGVALRLGMKTVLVPPDASLLSAMGLGNAAIERFAQRQVLRPLEEIEPRLDGLIEELETQAVEAVIQEGVAPEHILIRRRIVNMRFAGQEAALGIDIKPGLPIREAFMRQHEDVFGHVPPARAIEVESVRIVASSVQSEMTQPENRPRQGKLEATGTRCTYLDGRWRDVPLYQRSALHAGHEINGPALVIEPHSTTLIARGWSCLVDQTGTLVLQAKVGTSGEQEPAKPQAVQLELFTNRITSIATDMGQMLERTALSTNIKERLDFSCGVLDPDGRLVVNAPHIPVHLGALGMCVRSVVKELDPGPGDVIVTNHPAFGGSHLPDITVIAPVHVDQKLIGYAACRAHHAEIGGVQPGSMPPASTNLAEEGIVMKPMFLVRAGEPAWSAIKRLLGSGPFPSRAVDENIADLNAQLAAVRRGVQALVELADAHGFETVRRSMAELTNRAGQRIAAALRQLGDGTYEAVERLDDGSPIHVRIQVTDGSAVVDFKGSADVHPCNFNATPAIINSAVVYVLRLLVDEPLPLNEGLLDAVEIRLPRGMLNPVFGDEPARAPAVAGGNVETSQRVVDALIKALGIAAGSQGTMNNVIFGNERFGYYETVCGGAGATPAADGADAVHTHMTNTRITDPEILEHRYPVRLERFAIRRGSGGTGTRRGGDGVLREITFLEPVKLAILSQHRTTRPCGLGSGGPGELGEQHLIRVSGESVRIGSVDGCLANPGDRLVLQTPGGGGFTGAEDGPDRR